MQCPFVSICTPTFNRRPFFPSCIQCFQNQTYPKERMEWIIIDDGTDKIIDLVQDIKQVKYFAYSEKMVLGKKRNLMHEKCKGDIIIYMDDDDYYPQTRVEHAVETLLKNPQAMCAGSSEMNIYFKHIGKMYQFGPYKNTHSTAATFAFRKELLLETRYDDTSALAEEPSFLKNYTIPFVQLNVLESILVFSHNHNSVDKKKLLDSPNKYIKESDKKIEDFIKEPTILQFFMNDIDELLEKYEPGNPKYKPEVLLQIEEITDKRIERHRLQLNEQNKDKERINKLTDRIAEQNCNIQELIRENNELTNKVKYLEDKIKEVISNALLKHKKKSFEIIKDN
jgi:glycosyltransferase involved in cell wall biosynthesis